MNNYLLNPIKATIIEWDNVVRFFPENRERNIESRYRYPHGTIREIATHSSSIEQALMGTISDLAWRKNIIFRLKTLWPDLDAESAVRDWSNFSGILEYKALNEILCLKSIGPIVLLTNATNRLETDLREHGIIHHFSEIIGSSKVGFSKPSYEIYKLTLFKLKLTASEVLYIDHESSHLRTARGLGFNVYEFKNVEDLKIEILKILNPLSD